MAALTTLVPVFFMLGLGYLSRVKGWISPDQKAGANTIVFTVLFPILIFNLLGSAQLQLETAVVIVYVTLAFFLAMIVGRKLAGFTGKGQGHFSPYLLTTVEGGSVALPLYLSIVGQSSNTVIFDLAGSIIAFLVIPIMVAGASEEKKPRLQLAREVVSHPFVIAILLGLVFNFSGLYSWLIQSPFAPLYSGIMNTVTGPILGMILFVLGYDFKVDFHTLKAMLRLMSVRVVYYVLVILGFFLLFPNYMADQTFLIAVLLYFMCPTGFAMPLLIEETFKGEEDRTYAATFISLYMLVTIVVYTALVLIFV
ncbi:AEC family transporter [Streptococcus ferus]|uniref:Transporter protein n=1 Tax=Streptococcus ferus TaxID=1345 RepID=A0A2X3VG64_9STRE|nr:AEC family transporter [Streptococcus ferus]SQF40444.1 transporter protein [Streptococcus ferus]